MRGQKYAFASASLLLGITSFISLLGFEKAILAVVFGWLALKSLPGPVLAWRRGWAKAGIILGLLQVVLLVVILIVAREKIGQFLERLGDLSGSPGRNAASILVLPDKTSMPGSNAAEATPGTMSPARYNESVANELFPHLPYPNIHLKHLAKPFNWQQVESSDYRQYVANLRALGCPEQTVRDIIRADVNELFRERSRNSGTNRFEYWKSGNPFANLMTPERVAQRQEASRQKRDLLATLLGPNAASGPDTTVMLNPMIEALDFLPAEKVSSLMEMEQRYQARVLEAMKPAAQGDIGGLKTILAEHEAEALRILTPEEKLEYDVRLAPTAARLRLQMGDFAPTEEEFRKIFQLQKAFDDEFSPLGLPSRQPEDQQQRQAALLELNRQLEIALGTSRYQEYQQKKTASQGN